jgi:hypothetical protein
MMRATPTADLPAETIRQMAEAKLEAASKKLSTAKREELLKTAELLRILAIMKGYLSSNELRPPK